MQIQNYRYIKSLTLPNGWTENAPIGGIAAATVRSFSPASNPDVKMELFYRGLPISEEATKAFRKVLKLGSKVIFDPKNSGKPTSTDAQLICDLEEALGNVGNNQIANTQTGFSGPPFKLERLDALTWNEKPTLAVRGWFCNPETGENISAFCGFFIDSNPNESACKVEEIYLEAEDENLYLQFLPKFEQSLQSIEWL